MSVNSINSSAINDKDILTIPKKSKSLVLKNQYKITKRTADILVSLIGLIFLSPLFLIISIAVKLDSKGPAFFVHKRIGK